MMNRILPRSMLFFILLFALVSTPAFAVSVYVPGTSDPWLAGMPDGSIASYEDIAPNQSPVLVTDITLIAGNSLTFGVTGSVNINPYPSGLTPDGGFFEWHTTGSENGISNIYAPYNSLLGVFLGPNQPDFSIAPASLDFSTGLGLNYLSLSPVLQQVFFIGDGLTDGGQVQSVTVPDGATRLYLGTKDGFGWHNNYGFFDVIVGNNTCSVPEPGTILLLGSGLAGFGLFRRKVRKA